MRNQVIYLLIQIVQMQTHVCVCVRARAFVSMKSRIK
jgi:hypothetical protein